MEFRLVHIKILRLHPRGFDLCLFFSFKNFVKLGTTQEFIVILQVVLFPFLKHPKEI